MAYRRNTYIEYLYLLIFGILEFSHLATPLTGRSLSRRVLGFALADGPVLSPYIDEVDEDILGADARCPCEPVDDRLVDRLLLAGRWPSFHVIWMMTRSSLRSMPR